MALFLYKDNEDWPEDETITLRTRTRTFEDKDLARVIELFRIALEKNDYVVLEYLVDKPPPS